MSRSAWSKLLASLRQPLIQAPMAGVQGSALATAVSRAGALGSLPAAMLDVAALERELQRLQQDLGAHGLPYNVNFFCHTPPVEDAGREAGWRRLLAPYCAEWNLDPQAASVAPQRQPFNADLAAVLEVARPPVVSFHFGLPAPGLLDRVKACGALVLSSATTVEEALWLQARGVDAVIAQGLEAGGHRGHFLRADDDLSGQLPLHELLAELRSALTIPVVAAGGLGDAAAVAAAQRLGAQAVQVGTAFLLCPEASTPPLHRQALRQAAAGPDGGATITAAPTAPAVSTALTRLFTGRPARGLVNRLMREVDPLHPAAPAFPLAGGALAALRRHAEAEGRTDFTPLWSGQSPQGCREWPAAEVVAHLMRQWQWPAGVQSAQVH